VARAIRLDFKASCALIIIEMKRSGLIRSVVRRTSSRVSESDNGGDCGDSEFRLGRRDLRRRPAFRFFVDLFDAGVIVLLPCATHALLRAPFRDHGRSDRRESGEGRWCMILFPPAGPATLPPGLRRNNARARFASSAYAPSRLA